MLLPVREDTETVHDVSTKSATRLYSRNQVIADIICTYPVLRCGGVLAVKYWLASKGVLKHIRSVVGCAVCGSSPDGIVCCGMLVGT